MREKIFTRHLGRLTPNGFFDEALRWQTIIIEAHRIEDALTTHAVETCNNIGLCIRVTVTDVQFAGDGWRRGIDRKDGAGASGVKGVQVGISPLAGEARFGLAKSVTVGQHRMVLLLMQYKKTPPHPKDEGSLLAVPPCFDS